MSGTDAHAPDEAKLKADGATQERQRISGILGLDEAQGKNKLASHLAFETDMSVDQVKTILAASPLEEKQEAHSSKVSDPLATAMDQMGGAGVETEAAEAATEDDEEKIAMGMVAFADPLLVKEVS
mgnify:FL=1